MNPRGGSKRNICRYFSSGVSCYYGDSCQFKHVLETGVHPAGMLVSEGRTIPVVPPLRSQSAGAPIVTHPGAPVGRGHRLRINLPPSENLKRSEQSPFQGRPIPQRTTSYRAHHAASNPPKHRMGYVTRMQTPIGGGGVNHTPHSQHKLQSPPQKRDQTIGGGGGGGGNHGDDGSRRINALQPPPPSKQTNKIGPNTSPRGRPHVQSGGTTYFYSGQQSSFAPDYTVYTRPPSSHSLSHLPPSFFISEDLRQELYQQQLASLTVPSSEDVCPKEVDSYHSICPLESVDDATLSDQESKRLFGHSSTCYRAINQKDGLYYCLRRIHGCRLTSAKAVQELDKWKKVEHVNIVTLREMFTTKAFGDNSVVLVYDYHPAAKTLTEKHLRRSKRTSPLPEDLVWEYIVQLVSALRLVHSHQLALRCLDSTKVLVTYQRRIRINCGGILDILTFDANSGHHTPSIHQQGDLFSLGQLLLVLGLQSPDVGRPDQLHRTMDIFTKTYSSDISHLLQYLLQSGSKGPPHSILEVMPMLGNHIHLSVERALHREDVLAMELSKELQNGRLFKILAKLGTINERPEFSGDEQWSETGDRYLLKLLRDYLFHQVLPSGTPWTNLAHIVQTLNKIDAGSYENVALHSRDEQSVLVVSFADLKTCLEKTFTEILSTSSGSQLPPPPALPEEVGSNGSNGSTLNGLSPST